MYIVQNVFRFLWARNLRICVTGFRGGRRCGLVLLVNRNKLVNSWFLHNKKDFAYLHSGGRRAFRIYSAQVRYIPDLVELMLVKLALSIGMLGGLAVMHADALVIVGPTATDVRTGVQLSTRKLQRNCY